MLVGGFGTRLRPLTDSCPKQMLPVLHRPMIERVVHHLADHGIGEAVLSLGYRPDAFRDRYGDGTCAGVALRYAVEPEPLDTGGAIAFAARAAGIDETFVVVNGDVLTDLDVSALVAFHRARGAEGTVALHRVEDPSAFGVVATAEDGRVEAFVEKPEPGEAPSDRINAGTYVLEPEVLARIGVGERVNVERVVFPAMVADATLYALDDGGAYWIDAGTPDAYRRANIDLASGSRDPDLARGSRDPDLARGSRDPAVAPSARILGTAERSVVGEDCVVGPAAEVHGSVLLPGSEVAAGARVLDCVLGPHSLVGAAAHVERSVLGEGATVDAGATLIDVRRPAPGC